MAQHLVTPPPMRGLSGLRLRWAQGNAESIQRIPQILINEARRRYLIVRAMNGDDVRAWCDWKAPEYVGRWWLWDGASWDFITCKYGVKEFLGYTR